MNHFLRHWKVLQASVVVCCFLLATGSAFSQESSTTGSTSDRETEDADRDTENEPRRTDGTPLFVSDSNTGYIDDATIGTKFRVRMDGGYGMTSPDRAEFFYGRCGCARDVPSPPANTPHPSGEVLNPDAPGPSGIVIPGAILSSGLIETELDYQEIRFDFEYAFNRKFSLFAEVPLRSWDGTVLPDHAGLSDIRAGFKWGLLENPNHHLTFQFRGYFPTGDSEKGLGTDHYSLEPGLTYFGRLNERWTMAAELRYWAPIDGTDGRGTGFPDEFDYAGDILRYGIGFGYDFELNSGTLVTPVVEVVTWSVLGGLALSSRDGTPIGVRTPGYGYREADGENITNLKFGLRFGFPSKRSMYIGYGTAVSGDIWYDDVVRFEFRSDFSL